MRMKYVEIMTRQAQLSTDRTKQSIYVSTVDPENFRISALRVTAPHCQVTLPPSVAN
jgi:hypothetical protein